MVILEKILLIHLVLEFMVFHRHQIWMHVILSLSITWLNLLDILLNITVVNIITGRCMPRRYVFFNIYNLYSIAYLIILEVYTSSNNPSSTKHI